MQEFLEDTLGRVSEYPDGLQGIIAMWRITRRPKTGDSEGALKMGGEGGEGGEPAAMR
jgi:hypothetical protein